MDAGESIIIDSKLNVVNNIISLNEDVKDNIITINKRDYRLEKLSNLYKGKGNKGGNSFVYKLFDAQADDACPVKVIKISNKPNNSETGDRNNISTSKYNKKFEREVHALLDCKKKEYQHVISIYEHGNIVCHKTISQKKRKKTVPPKTIPVFYPFYTMDYADYDLKSFFENPENELDCLGKVDLCLDIAKGLTSLHKEGYYHRDIKPDNILFVGKEWQLGDLGLIAKRDEDYDDLYNANEFIGPRGWISPEVMNRFLLGNTENPNGFDCKIDDYSDVFQLGRVFWFIFQGNSPVGNIRINDFIDPNIYVYGLIRNMIYYNKKNRYSLIDVINRLESIRTDLLRF